MKYVTTIDGQEYVVEIVDDSHVRVNGKLYAVDFDSVSDQPVYSLLLDGRSFEAYVYPGEEHWQVLLHGRSYPAQVEDELARSLRQASASQVGEGEEFQLRAPMPGLVVAVPVEEGGPVKKGEVLVILESMKMQNELKSPRDGMVSRVRIKAGDSVEQRQVMLSVV